MYNNVRKLAHVLDERGVRVCVKNAHNRKYKGTTIRLLTGSKLWQREIFIFPLVFTAKILFGLKKRKNCGQKGSIHHK